MSRPTAILFTHSHAAGMERAVEVAHAAAERHGWDLVPSREAEGHRPSLFVVLGGDGTILHALRASLDGRVPVFGINFGRVGFLAGVEADQIELGLDRAFAGEYEVLDLPGLSITANAETHIALNDASFSRRPRGGVAELSYRIAGEEVGHVRCDGLVASTATGSTGYNLANHGPILAWGVAGYVVSYIAPHTLTARALVVAPGDVLHVMNHRSRDGVDIAVDGVQIGELSPGAEAEVSYLPDLASLAQLPGSNFYHRIREKFGHLAV
ncbi:MAG: NAD(+)/NADH kinase [Solirubrobacterales bacterium]|nr:NAD(+)/NADH kinase [Solirubrobacterales bacterium]MCB0862022.1 NAD(+)/NADH kinase [Solirubrobacterales bacterium]MCB8915290.1 NAD(+)/NADH kinase [Thermoleophilales bacterium]